MSLGMNNVPKKHQLVRILREKNPFCAVTIDRAVTVPIPSIDDSVRTTFAVGTSRPKHRFKLRVHVKNTRADVCVVFRA